MFRKMVFAVAIVLSASVLPPPAARAAKPQAPAEFLSASTAAYLEIKQPQVLLEAGLNDQTVALLNRFEPVQKYLESKDYQTLQAVLTVLEQKLGSAWRPALEKLVGGGITAAFDSSEQAVYVFVRSRDASLLADLHAALVELITADAQLNSRESPVKSNTYHGRIGWTFGKGEAHVLIGDMLIVSNKAEALKAIVNRIDESVPENARDDAREEKSKKKSRPLSSLANDRVFQTAQKHAESVDAGFAFVRLAPLRLLMGLSKALGNKSDNPLLELLTGGLLDAVGRADYAAITLRLNDEGLRLAAHLPHNRTDVAASRRWFFAGKSPDSAAAPLDGPATIAAFTAYRDVSGMWLARNELFDDTTNVGFTQADTNLGLYFSGKDFGSQVLAELEPQWRLIAVRREFGVDGEPIPALKLPGFALVWELKHPAAFAPHLQMAFQNIIGLTNLDGAQKGRPQLLLESERRGEAEIHYGTYLLVGDVDQANAPIYFNFRPACARVGKHFVIGSHVELVRELADRLTEPPAAPTTSDNLLLDIRSQELARALEANRALIVGRQMLAAGGDKQTAEENLNLGLELLRLLERASIRLVDGEQTLTLEAAIELLGK